MQKPANHLKDQAIQKPKYQKRNRNNSKLKFQNWI